MVSDQQSAPNEEWCCTSATVPWPVLIFGPTEDRRLSWHEWLVTYQDGIPANGHPSVEIKKGSRPHDPHL